MESTNNEVTITGSLLNNEQRLYFFEKAFGTPKSAVFNEAETVLFHFASSLCEKYAGGYWDFYSLSNEGYYAAPRMPEPLLTVSSHLSGATAQMSPQAFGITATLFALGHLANKYENDLVTENYYRLKEFIYGHPESAGILRVID